MGRPVVSLLWLLCCLAVTAQQSETASLLQGDYLIISNFCFMVRADLLSLPLELAEHRRSSDLAGVHIYFSKRPSMAGAGRVFEFGVDTGRCEVMFFSAIRGLFPKPLLGPTNQSMDALSRLASRDLERLGISTNMLRLTVRRIVQLSALSKRGLAEFGWLRCEQGCEFKHDMVRLVYDAIDGELIAFRKVWGEAPTDWDIQIQVQQAKGAAIMHLTRRFGIAGVVQVGEAKLAVVRPNDFFGASVKGPAIRRLAWVIPAPKQPEVQYGLEIWINAKTCEVLGGDVLL